MLPALAFDVAPPTLRLAGADDAVAIEALLDVAFGPARRARTAYALRAGGAPMAALSFVVWADGVLVGSLQCWPTRLVGGWGERALTLLGPVAVAPERRGAGIGAAMMDACMDAAGDRPMLLIGDADYYGRWGFGAAATAGWAVPGPVDRARLLARGVEGWPGEGRVEADR